MSITGVFCQFFQSIFLLFERKANRLFLIVLKDIFEVMPMPGKMEEGNYRHCNSQLNMIEKNFGIIWKIETKIQPQD